MYSQELTIGIAHALLGDQQDDRAQHQDSAQYIEDGSTHTTGGGQGRAGFVFDLSGNRKLRGIRDYARNQKLKKHSKRILYGRSHGL